MIAEDLARSLLASSYPIVSWGADTNEELSDRIAAGRVRHAGDSAGKARLRLERWLLFEWPSRTGRPHEHILATVPADIALHELVAAEHQRWPIERDYLELKQDFGLGHYEGRGWRAFHHYAGLCIAAHGYLMTERLMAGRTNADKSGFALRQVPTVPDDCIDRGSPARAATRGDIHRIVTPQLSHELLLRLDYC